MSNLSKVRVTVRGTRPLLQHKFGPESLPLEKEEREGVAGNNPGEWKKTCMVTPEGQLYIKGTYVFSCLRNGSKHTKKGRGSIQSQVAATLQVEEQIILLNRWMPKEGDPPMEPVADVYIDVAGVRNPATKARNVRYRLAASSGWEATFTIFWDKTLVAREQMKAVARDSGVYGGLGDGISIGFGRFEVTAWEELTDAEEKATARSLELAEGDGSQSGRKPMRSLQNAVVLGNGEH